MFQETVSRRKNTKYAYIVFDEVFEHCDEDHADQRHQNGRPPICCGNFRNALCFENDPRNVKEAEWKKKYLQNGDDEEKEVCGLQVRRQLLEQVERQEVRQRVLGALDEVGRERGHHVPHQALGQQIVSLHIFQRALVDA